MLRAERSEEKKELTVWIVVTFGAVNFSFLVDAKEEFLVGEQFPSAHISLQMIVAAPYVAPDHRRGGR